MIHSNYDYNFKYTSRNHTVQRSDKKLMSSSEKYLYTASYESTDIKISLLDEARKAQHHGASTLTLMRGRGW